MAENQEEHPQKGAPVDLRTEYLESPIGLEVRRPVLSWRLPWTTRGAAQTGFRVVAASSFALLEQSGPYVWDSGRVASGNTSAGYAGPGISSGDRLYFKVQAWDETGKPTAWSQTAFFEMGLLHAGEWKGPWMAAPGILAPLFRSTFNLADPKDVIAHARLYISGLGYFEARLNGGKLGTQVLAPEYSDYTQQIYYLTFDVEPHLRQGENVLGLILGRGWFEHFEYGQSQFRCQLQIARRDGSTQIIAARPDEWRMATGPWLECDIYNGESYDARLEKEGWDWPGYDERGEWSRVKAARKQAPGKLVGLRTQPISVTQDLEPVAVNEARSGTIVLDFGQNMAGWVKLRLSGRSGTVVRMRFAEWRGDDGTVDQENLEGARATDHYTLKGSGIETWEPRFTYHGFRYVQLDGLPALPEEWSASARCVHSDVPRRGRFVCSDERLTRLSLNVDWTLRSNIMSIFTDCPQRDERQGWLGDGHLVAETVFHHFNPGAFYRKWLEDIRGTQDEEGRRWSPTAPVWVLDGDNATGGKVGYFSKPERVTQEDVVWTAAGTLIPWYLYMYNNDVRVIEEHLPVIAKHIDFIMSQPHAPLVPFNRFGDWMYVDFADPKGPTDRVLLSTAIFLEQVNCAVGMAAALQRLPLQAKLEKYGAEISRALRTRFYQSEHHTFGSQTADALALTVGFVPQTERQSVVDHLVEDIRENHSGHLAAGIVGTRFLLEALSREGRFDVAYRIVTAEGFPGWMEMLKNGATTITERWHYKGHVDNSHNHAAFGVVSAWMFRWIGGVRIDPDFPGYGHFTVAPETPADLDFARVELDTVRGPLVAGWEQTEMGFTLDLQVPPTALATVVFPGSERADVVLLESDKPCAATDFLTPKDPDPDNGRKRVSVKSGEYHFSVVNHSPQIRPT